MEANSVLIIHRLVWSALFWIASPGPSKRMTVSGGETRPAARVSLRPAPHPPSSTRFVPHGVRASDGCTRVAFGMRGLGVVGAQSLLVGLWWSRWSCRRWNAHAATPPFVRGADRTSATTAIFHSRASISRAMMRCTRHLVAAAGAAAPSGRRLRPSHTIRSFSSSSSPSTAAAPDQQPAPETRVQASIQSYERHIFVASRTPYRQWAKRLEERGGSPAAGSGSGEETYARLIDAVKAKAFTSHNPLAPDDVERMAHVTQCPRLTVFDVGSAGDGASAGASESSGAIEVSDLVVFSLTDPPAHLSAPVQWPASTTRAVDLRTDAPLDLDDELEMKRVLRILERPTDAAPPATTTEGATPQQQQQHEFDFELMAFVCCHTQRDQRCGDRGPAVVDAINAYARRRRASSDAGASTADGGGGGSGGARIRIRAFACSHVGGHEFAGNVLLYGWRRLPSEEIALAPVQPIAAPYCVNDWFGLVAPGNVPALLDAYVDFLPRYLQEPLLAREQARTLRADLLQQLSVSEKEEDAAAAAASIDGGDAASCAKCATLSPPLVSSSVRTLAQLWRGSMGTDKADARNIARAATHAAADTRSTH